MKRANLFVCLMMFVGVFSVSLVARGQSPDSYWWHYRLTQTQRDNLILQKALSVPDGMSGGQCKVWVQNVVSAASYKVVWLPQNNPNCAWQWYWSPDVEVMGTDKWNGTTPWQPGYIVQCQVRTTAGGLSPHTFIIQYATPNGVYLIESNWRGDERVYRRYATWTTLQNQIVHYTLYRVK